MTPLAQQRRLAEFATILGDYKLAIPIWEVVRKEGKGGSVSTNASYRLVPEIPSLVRSQILGNPPAATRC